MAEIGEVEGVDVLEIPVSVLVSGSIHAVDEVVIHRDDDGLDTIDEQLDLQSLGEGGLSR